MPIAIPRWSKFETVWESAIRACDRYELGKTKRQPETMGDACPNQPTLAISSPEPCATDVPAQTHPPVAV